MPLEMQTTLPVPNSIYFPQILIQTGIQNGDLVSSCQLTLTAAIVDANGKWTSTGHSKTVYLADMLNLEADLTELAPLVGQIYGGIITLVDQLNVIRKIL
jgi:hypothetical protein